MHHMAKSFFAPIMVTVVPQNGRLVLRVVNDTPDVTEVSLTAYATDMAGVARELGRGSVNVGNRAETLLDLDATLFGPQEMLAFGWTATNGAKGGDVFAPRPYKTYDLLPPGLTPVISLSDGVWTITLTASAMAFFVSAEASVPGRFSTNAIHLGPGHTAAITFTPQDPKATPAFTLRDLYSATTA